MRRMTKRFGAAALVFLASAFSFATVSVSGNLVNPATGSVSSRAFVRFWIRGCGGNQARVSGTGVILPSFTDLTPTAGAISGTLYDSLTEISCGGSVGATWYGVQAYYDGKPGPEVPYNVTGASFNLNSATPNTTSPVVSAPTGDSTYCRIDAGNCGFTGTVSPSTDNTRDLGSSAAKWRTGYFGTGLRINDVDLTRSAADTLQLATGDQFLPQTSGQFFGGASNRWAGFFSTLNVGTSITLPSTSIADAALSSNVALYNNGSKTWCASASCVWNMDIGSGGGSFTLQPKSITSGTSGTLALVGGAFSSGSGAGGAASISGGSGGPSGGAGGSASVSGGSAQFGAADGGDVTLQAGNGSGAGKPGAIIIVATAAPNLSVIGNNAKLYFDGGFERLKVSEGGGAYGPVVNSPCITSQKAESGADTNVLTCTPPVVAGSYRIRFTEDVSAQNTATMGWTATWTDSTAHAQAPTNLSLFKSGTAAPALTFVAATNDHYYGYIDIDIDSSGTNIVVKTTFAGTSFTSKVTASVERIN